VDTTKNLLAGEYTLGEGYQWFAKKATEFVLSIIPDEEGAPLLIERMRKDVDEKMMDWQHATTYVDRLVGLKNSKLGKIPERKAYLERLNARGEQLGKQYQEMSEGPEKETLLDKLKRYENEVKAVTLEVANLEAELKTRRETMSLREQTYRDAALELENFERMAPMMIEHTKAVMEADDEKKRALKKSQEHGATNANRLLEKLQLENATAVSSLSATVHLQEQVASANFDIEADLEQAESAAPDSLLSKWTTTAK